MATYPTSATTFPTRVDGDVFNASYINALQDEVTALETSLVATGTLPSPITVAGTRPQVVLKNGTTTNGYIRAEQGYMVLGQNITKNAAGGVIQDDTGLNSTQIVLASVGGFQGGMILNGAAPGPNPPPVPTRMVVDSLGAMYERARGVAMGDWTNVPYAAGLFTASTGTWTINTGAGAYYYSYTLIGKCCYLSLYLAGSSPTAAAAWLRVNTPAGCVVASTTLPPYGNYACFQNPGAPAGWSECLYTLAPNVVTFFPTGGASGAFSAGGNVYVACNCVFEMA